MGLRHAAHRPPGRPGLARLAVGVWTRLAACMHWVRRGPEPGGDESELAGATSLVELEHLQRLQALRRCGRRR